MCNLQVNEELVGIYVRSEDLVHRQVVEHEIMKFQETRKLIRKHKLH
jgi:hypothetical protein